MEERFQYNCPLEGKLCRHGKHCTALVLAEPLKEDLHVRVQCSVMKEETGGREKERVVHLKAA